MGVKIFLPKELFFHKSYCKLFGEIQISESSISYFIIDTATGSDEISHLRHLGHISADNCLADTKDVALSFTGTPTISLNRISIKPPNCDFGNLFLYDKNKMQLLHWSEAKPDELDEFEDIRTLFVLLRQNSIRQKTQNDKKSRNYIFSIFDFIFESMNLIFSLIEKRPLPVLIKKTSLYEHYIEWKQVKALGNRVENMYIDKFFGIVVMIVLLLCVNQPGEYLIQASQYIIERFRILLVSLKGSPIGLKLNVHLNNFLLDCFSYHVDLWATFLNLIEQVVRQVFVPIGLLGIMGLSFQLAMLSDLISLIGVHSWCFYIYSAILYKIEIKGLQVLWKVVLGKRRNRLKQRDESHNYMNRQLFLSTMFFTSLLFLFPTILVYYVVFTTLRLCIYSVKLVLKTLCRQILAFPFNLLLKWMLGRFYELDSLQVQYKNVPFPSEKTHLHQMKVSVFEINVRSSSLNGVFLSERRILKKLTTKDNNSSSVKNIVLYRILHGQF